MITKNLVMSFKAFSSLLLCVVCLSSVAQISSHITCEPVRFNYIYDDESEDISGESVTFSFLEQTDAGLISITNESTGEDVLLTADKYVYYNEIFVIFNTEEYRLFIPRKKIKVGSNPADCSIVLRNIEEDGAISFHIGEFDEVGALQDKLTKKSQLSINQYNSMVDYVNQIVSNGYSGYYRKIEL